jgi:hypothetical protein
MTLGEKLLNLTVEYQAAVAARSEEWDEYGGKPVGREPSEIAAEYEDALRALVPVS